MTKIRASAISASIAKEQREDQRAPPVRETGLPPPPPKWSFSNTKATIEATGSGRPSKRVLWTRSS
jgi:hypothetical protein